MTLYTFELSTPKENFYNITAQVREAAADSGVRDGAALVFCPHTTAGITINENADPDVVRDLLLGLDKAFPDRTEFRHAEGNSAAHLKASAIGSSQMIIIENGKLVLGTWQMIIIENGKLVLGTWQGIYFCEFDPPRKRKFHVKIIGGGNDNDAR
ncbi:MAG: secondary thiamine-phosphate synthase enzyme YjbQ [Clostridiales bacterium]|nr:secondary thiamine-phosphate synthase enzyme YjbQ [Clostridiales bacterium]